MKMDKVDMSLKGIKLGLHVSMAMMVMLLFERMVWVWG